jgi:DNA-directed RNA polymerase specialized sigma24 family protein
MSQAMSTDTSSPAGSPANSPANKALGDPALHRSLQDFVRRRVPASDVDDVVQTVLCDALAAPGRPADPIELRRWILGIARHKVVDLHRRAHRELPAELPDIEDSPAPMEARELAGWAERQAADVRDAQKTLAWMAREGEGEKLEAIAAEEKVPAARVRQRVSRMRRWMKERWAAELAAVAMLGALALAAWWLLHGRSEPPVARDLPMPTISPEPSEPVQKARALRADALRACDRSEWRTCLDGLDQARGLDPEGDVAPVVGAARASAQAGLRAAPPPDSAAPSSNGSVAAAPKPPTTAVPKPAPTSDGTPFFGPDQKSKPSGSTPGGEVRTKGKQAATKVLDSPTFGK